jgi:type VI secretion system secreted protein Hcp
MADIFLKFEPALEGESLDKKHKNEIEILSWSWGVSQAGSMSHGGGGGAGKATIHDMHLSKKVDKASADLFMKCASGKHFTKATLVQRKAGGEQEEFYKVELTEVVITQVNMHGGTDQASEDLTLTFSKVEMEYKPQLDTGKLGAAKKAGWNIKENAKV